jgi:DNA-binding CsgD family transcriptional regulator
MQRHVPRKDELLTVIFAKQIKNFFASKIRTVPFDFFGMAERTPYGSIFASSDPAIAELLYKNAWYSADSAINRDILKSDTKGIIQIPNKKIQQEILQAKKKQCDQIGNFTIPVIRGETELYFCIAASTQKKLEFLKKNARTDLLNIGLEFRQYMHFLANPMFAENQKTREKYSYYIADDIAYEGKEALNSVNLQEKFIELTRFEQRANRIFRLTGKNFNGYSSDHIYMAAYNDPGTSVEELPIVKSPLFQEYEKSIFYPGINNDISSKSSDDHFDKKLKIINKNSQRPVQLSTQQRRCLMLLAEGKSTKEIAAVLQLSARTVEHYIAKIRHILGCKTSKELIASLHLI